MDPVSYNDITVKGVFCDGIIIISNNDEVCQVTAVLTEKCGAKGMLLRHVKNMNQAGAYTISRQCMEIPCSTFTIPMSVPVKLERNGGGSMVSLSSTNLDKRAMMGIIDVVFHNVESHADGSLGNNVYTVTYESVSATLVSTSLTSRVLKTTSNGDYYGVVSQDIDTAKRLETHSRELL